MNRRVRQLAVKRLAVAHTAAQEARRWRNGHLGLHRLGQQTPKQWVMPTEVVSGTIPVSANTRAEAHHLGHQAFAIKTIKILIDAHDSHHKGLALDHRTAKLRLTQRTRLCAAGGSVDSGGWRGPLSSVRCL